MITYFKKSKRYGRKLEGNEIRDDKETSDIKVSILILLEWSSIMPHNTWPENGIKIGKT